MNFFLSKKSTVAEIKKYCENKTECKKHKEDVSKRILEVSGYKTDGPITGYTFTDILFEIAKLSNKRTNTLSEENRFMYAEDFRNILETSAGDNLRSFLRKSGIKLENKRPSVLDRYSGAS